MTEMQIMIEHVDGGFVVSTSNEGKWINRSIHVSLEDAMDRARSLFTAGESTKVHQEAANVLRNAFEKNQRTEESNGR